MKELEGEKNWGAWYKTPKETIKNYGTKKSKGTNKQTENKHWYLESICLSI